MAPVPMRLLPWWVLCTLSAMVMACSNGGSSGSCVTNQDCATDQQCVSGKCLGAQSIGGCESDDDCGVNETCNAAGQCEREVEISCDSDAQCPSDKICNINTGRCIDGFRTCTDDSACGAGTYCVVAIQQCRECLDSSHCDPGFSCVSNACVENTQSDCLQDTDCGPPASVCEGGACVAGCSSPNTPIACGGGTVCDSATGRCVPAQVSCTADFECGPPNRVCESQQCVPGCAQSGGLQCTGGFICNTTTGRCAPPGGCGTDSECGAPASICENGSCVAGCGAGGPACPAQTVCDNNTGRCVPLTGPCSLDSDCAPPTEVCEFGQCVGGCGQPAGLQCTGNTVCNPSSGRCDPGSAVCTTDAECGPPASICDFVTGQCMAGCVSTGCTGTDTCNSGTGRCQPPVQGNGTLNSICTGNSDCDSTVCFNLGGTAGSRCVQSCGAGSDCPVGFLCTNFSGAKMCVASEHFNGSPSFSQPNGASCSDPGVCNSGFCPQSTGVCTETCTHDSDCGGTSCGWFEAAPDVWGAACVGPIGSLPPGSSCSADTDCASGICDGQCLAMCTSTADCPQGTTCFLEDYSVCPGAIGPLCIGGYVPYFVRACLPSTHGQDPVGATCFSFDTCRSGLCHLGVSECTDVCGTDADCPATHRCKIEQAGQLPDGQAVYLNACLPASY